MKINIKDLFMTPVSIFETPMKTKPDSRMEVLPLCSVLMMGHQYKTQIEECRKYSNKETIEIEKRYKDCKTCLPVYTPSCLCGKGIKDIVRVNNILCIDIDEQDNPGMNPEKVKEDLMKLPSVFFSSLSIGGHGVFGLMGVELNPDNCTKEEFTELYKYVKEYIFNLTGYTIDKHCSNVNRLRIISIDDNCIYKDWNDSLELFKWKRSTTKQNIHYKDILDITLPKRNKTTDFTDLLNDDHFCLCCCDFCINQLGIQTTDYQNWISHLGSLTSLGVDGEILGIQLSRQSPHYLSDEDVKKTMKSLSKKNGQRQFLLRYFNMCKRSIGPGWIQEIKNIYEN